jgi:DNA polymerase I
MPDTQPVPDADAEPAAPTDAALVTEAPRNASVIVRDRHVLSGVQLHLVDSVDEALEFKRWLGQRREGPLGLDTESGGLSPFHDRLRLIQFGDLHQGWAIPWELWGGVALEALDAYEGELVAHNASYDAKVLAARAGWHMPFHRLHDTMTLAAIVNPLRPKGLKPLAVRLVDSAADSGKRLLDDGMKTNGWTWDTVPIHFKPYWFYSALDPVLTCHLFAKLHPPVAAGCPRVYDLERAVLRIVTAMMLKGMRLDLDYIAVRRGQFVDFRERARAWLRDVHALTSLLSSRQLERAFTSLGEQICEFTETGLPRFDREALQGYEHSGGTESVRELARTVGAARHAEKMISTYLDNFTARCDTNGLLHCSINPMNARTGRMSVSEPSLQNLPRKDTAIRGAFIPREGHVLISCDADQIEARMAAHIAGDQGLVRAFLAAEQPDAPDFFTVLARELYHDPQLTRGDERRQLMKTFVYAKLYGSGLTRLARTSGAPYEQVTELNAAFRSRYPGLERLMHHVTGAAAALHKNGRTPGVSTLMGRFLPGEPDRFYALLNYLIQGSAAEVLKRGMVDLDAAGLLEYMLLPIHDEVLLDVPRPLADEVLHTVESVLTDRDTYRVPITWSGDILEERWTKI